MEKYVAIVRFQKQTVFRMRIIHLIPALCFESVDYSIFQTVQTAEILIKEILLPTLYSIALTLSTVYFEIPGSRLGHFNSF